MTSTWDFDTTNDAFLGGLLTITQPRTGYRAGVDPVLLAASIPAKSGQSLLDLGCGVGTAMLCVHARTPGLTLTGVELQPNYAALAAHNITQNTATGTVHNADITALPLSTRFDHVIANPPYFDRHSGTPSANPARDTAFAHDTPLATWIKIAAKRTAPKGTLTVIQRADRLPDILRALPPFMGSILTLPITGRAGREADRIILRARHSGRAPFRLLPALHLHDGATHDTDRPDYTPQINEILRNGAPLAL